MGHGRLRDKKRLFRVVVLRNVPATKVVLGCSILTVRTVLVTLIGLKALSLSLPSTLI